MWVERISLENFLAFASAAVDLAPGLNVVLSPNEGGKSSLFRGIVTALFVDSSSRSSEIRALGRWGSESLFRIELHLRFKDASVRLVRDYRSKEQAIYREGENAPIARGKAVDEFLGEHLPFADQNLFLRVCGVRHEELARVSDGAAIGEKIEEMLGGGWGDVTPARLKQTIEAKRRDLLKGRDRPAYEENAGPVRRFMNRVEEAEREFAKATESARRREELLRSISSLSSDIGRLDEDIAILKSKRDKAARCVEIERKQKEGQGKADELRSRIDRVRALASKKEELLREGGRFPEPLRSRGIDAVEELRRELEREALLAHEIAAASPESGKVQAGRARKAPLSMLIIAGVLILCGILSGIFWEKPMFIVLVLGIGLVMWYLWGSRGAERSAPAAEKYRDLERLTNKRLAWSLGRGLDDSKNLLERYAGWNGELRDVDSRLEELGAGKKAEYGELLRRLDNEYGRIALEARALSEEGTKLEPFKADAGEILKLERDIRLREEDRERVAAERAKREKELAALEYLDVNEVSERLESAREHLKRAERKAEVMELILDALEKARREMSGFLAERLPPLAAEYLSRITERRYRTLFIDPLTMKIETAPASGDGAVESAGSKVPARVEPGLLSQGARDQIYLAVRLALIELLSHGEAQPIFLDDPFVHFDAARRERAIEVIRDFSRTHQVVMFTCDPYYRCLGWNLVELAR